MQVYTLEISNRALSLASSDSTMVRTTRLADQLEIFFDSDEWLDFDLSCAFSRGGEITEVPITLDPADGWAARALVDVPDSVLEATGNLGITIHGGDESAYIVTALSIPLTIAEEGREA
jgi:hypothetical protein